MSKKQPVTTEDVTQDQEVDLTAPDTREKIALKFKAPYKRYSNGDIGTFNAATARNILALKPVVATEL